MQTWEHQVKMSRPIYMKAHRAVLAVHSSLVSTEVLDFLHPFHLVLICDRVRGAHPALVKHHSSHWRLTRRGRPTHIRSDRHHPRRVSSSHSIWQSNYVLEFSRC